MTAHIIPLPFKGDLIDYLKLHGREIEWLWRDAEAYIPAKPICDILGLSWSRQRKVLTNPETEACGALKATQDTIGRTQEMLCIAYPDFMIWLAGISPSKVKEEAREAVRATRSEIKTLIARHYHDRLFGEMAAYRQTDERMILEIVSRRAIYFKIQQASRFGWSFDQIWRANSYSRPQIADAADYLYRLGAIERLPEGMSIRQLHLFSEG